MPLKKLALTHHCGKKFESRIVYNSNFVQTHLFNSDVVHSLKSLPVCKNKSYSDVVKSRVSKISSEKHTACGKQSKRVMAKTHFDCKGIDSSIAKSDNLRVRPPQCCKMGVPPIGIKIPLRNRFSVLSTICPSENPMANVGEVNRDKCTKPTLINLKMGKSDKKVRSVDNEGISREKVTRDIAFMTREVSTNIIRDKEHFDKGNKKSDTVEYGLPHTKYDLGLTSLARKCQALRKAKYADFNKLF